MICWVDLGGAVMVGWWVWVEVVLLMVVAGGGGVVDGWQVVGWLGLKGGCVGFWVCSRWREREREREREKLERRER